MPHYKIILSVLIVIFFSCKKNEAYDVPVRGNVRNNCTGLPFVQQKVNLNYDKKSFSTVTDSEGNFDFGSVIMHPKDNFNYQLKIPNFSNADYEVLGITVQLNKNEIKDFHQFGISASFKRIILVYPVMSNSTDTLYFIANQKTLRQNEPQQTTEIKLKIFNILQPYDFGINNYPMGWWYITVNKYKGSIRSTVYDSIYMDMGATQTYTIPW